MITYYVLYALYCVKVTFLKSLWFFELFRTTISIFKLRLISGKCIKTFFDFIQTCWQLRDIFVRLEIISYLHPLSWLVIAEPSPMSEMGSCAQAGNTDVCAASLLRHNVQMFKTALCRFKILHDWTKILIGGPTTPKMLLSGLYKLGTDQYWSVHDEVAYFFGVSCLIILRPAKWRMGCEHRAHLNSRANLKH